MRGISDTLTLAFICEYMHLHAYTNACLRMCVCVLVWCMYATDCVGAGEWECTISFFSEFFYFSLTWQNIFRSFFACNFTN